MMHFSRNIDLYKKEERFRIDSSEWFSYNSILKIKKEFQFLVIHLSKSDMQCTLQTA